MKVMSALAVAPGGTPIGISSQVWWTRPQRERLEYPRRREVTNRETQHWCTAIDEAHARFREHAPQTRVCFVLDREGDSQTLLRHAERCGVDFIIRARHNRRLSAGVNSKKRWRAAGARKLFDTAKQRRIAGTRKLTLPAREGAKSREVTLAIRFTQVTLTLQDQCTSRVGQPMVVNVVDVRERGRGRKGQSVSWTLLTNRPVKSAADAWAVVTGYTYRWRIEELHRTWKSGTCNVERSQLRSVAALTIWATVLAAVAARVERIKYLSREEPDAPALEAYSGRELEVLRLLRRREHPRKKPPPVGAITVWTATCWIAELGGYMQNSHTQRPPGSVVSSRGLERVQHYINALEMVDVLPSRPSEQPK